MSDRSSPRRVRVRRRFRRPARHINNLWEATRAILIGRKANLRELADRFAEERSQGEIRNPHVICGEAGVGKSVLARQVAEETAGHYAAVWWIDASDVLKIRAGLREFARLLGIPSADMDLSTRGEEAERQRFLFDLHEFLEARTLRGRALIILDNVDEPQLKNELPAVTLRYLPANACDVLITSQSKHWHPIAPTNTHLGGLDCDSCAELVAHECGRPELATNRNVLEICRAFGGRPLFLKQVASLLRDGDDPAEFRSRLERSTEHALKVLPGLESFEPLWQETYRLCIDRAERACDGARVLLEAMAFFSAEPVPVSLLYATAGDPQEQRRARVDAALSALTERFLIDVHRQSASGDRVYTMHRVIAALVRGMARGRGSLMTGLGVATSAITKTIPDRPSFRSTRGQQIMVTLAPHVDAVTTHVVENRNTHTPPQIQAKAAEASSLLGLYRRTLSEWGAAEDACRKGVLLSDALHEPSHTALRKVRLANVMRQRAAFGAAEALLDEALPTLRQHSDVREYAWALTVQARILRHRPDSAAREALPLLMEAMRLLKRCEYQDPPLVRQISELHGYLSVLRRQLSQLDAAAAEARDGLCIITAGMSADDVLQAAVLPNDPLVATHLRALGGVWRLRGELHKALTAHERALQIFEHVYGRDHSDVCRALDSLGRVQREWGDFEGALTTFARARKISDIRFGPNYAHAGTAAVNRALTYLELLQARKAREEAVRGLRIYCRAYDEQYINTSASVIRNEATAWAIFVRANAFADLGDYSRAKKDHDAILTWRQRRYPEVHALTASSHYALGDVLWRLGDSESKTVALAHHDKALAMRKLVFGTGQNYWLAQSQGRVGWLARNDDLVNCAYQTYVRQLRANHWRVRETAEIMNALQQGAEPPIPRGLASAAAR